MSHCVNYRVEMLTVHTLTQWDFRSGLRAAQDFPESGVCETYPSAHPISLSFTSLSSDTIVSEAKAALGY